MPCARIRPTEILNFLHASDQSVGPILDRITLCRVLYYMRQRPRLSTIPTGKLGCMGGMSSHTQLSACAKLVLVGLF